MKTYLINRIKKLEQQQNNDFIDELDINIGERLETALKRYNNFYQRKYTIQDLKCWRKVDCSLGSILFPPNHTHDKWVLRNAKLLIKFIGRS